MGLWISLVAVYYFLCVFFYFYQSNQIWIKWTLSSRLTITWKHLGPKKKVTVTRKLTDLNKNPNLNIFPTLKKKNVWLLQKLWVKNCIKSQHFCHLSVCVSRKKSSFKKKKPTDLTFFRAGYGKPETFFGPQLKSLRLNSFKKIKEWK